VPTVWNKQRGGRYDESLVKAGTCRGNYICISGSAAQAAVPLVDIEDCVGPSDGVT